MALTKESKDDYEVRGEYKFIQVRTKTSIMEDGEELSYSYNRRVLSPNADVSGESAEIQALAGALWTDELKSAYADSIAVPEEESPE